MTWMLLLLAIQPPAFEVASLKPTAQRARAVGTVRTYPGGRVTIEGSPLEHLVEVALDVQRLQVTGGPDWTYVEGFRFSSHDRLCRRSGFETGSLRTPSCS